MSAQSSVRGAPGQVRVVPLSVKRGGSFEVHVGDVHATFELGGDRRSRILVRATLPPEARVERVA